MSLALIFIIFYKNYSHKTENKPIYDTSTNKKEPVASIAEKKLGIIFPDFSDRVPIRYTCDGENINPKIRIENIPENTKSMVLLMNDPDAPDGSFNHWVLYNINPHQNVIEENSTPENSIVGINELGRSSYTGPCPPRGQDHRYVVIIYALTNNFSTQKKLTKLELEDAINPYMIQKASAIARFERR